MIFHKKIIKKKTLKPEHRNAKHKKSTKAALKREFLINCHRAIEHMEVFNRIQMVNEKLNHLNAAIVSLEKGLEQRPSNHLLRNQIKICREEHNLLKETNKRSSDHTIEIILSLDLF